MRVLPFPLIQIMLFSKLMSSDLEAMPRHAGLGGQLRDLDLNQLDSRIQLLLAMGIKAFGI